MHFSPDIDQRSSSRRFTLDRMEAIYDRSGGAPDQAHRHQYYTVLVVESAAGQHLIDFEAQPLRGSQVHFVAPGQVHQVKATERPVGAVITFTTDFLLFNNIPPAFITDTHLFRPFGDHPPLEPSPETFAHLSHLVADMAAHYQGQLPHRERALGALLQLFLIHCHHLCDLPAQDTGADAHVTTLRDFKSLVEGHFRQWHMVQDYAEALHLNRKTLSQTIKSLTGTTAKQFIQRRITLEGKRYLLHTDLSVKEIAYRLGFEEPLHFSGFFKKQTGTAPTDFREQNRF